MAGPNQSPTRIDPSKLKCNPQHLEVLRRGIKEWNEWRKRNPNVTPNLEGVDFTDPSVWKETPLWVKDGVENYLPKAHVTLSGNEEDAANFSGTNFDGATLCYCQLEYGVFSNARFSHCDMSHAYMGFSDFIGAKLHNTDLREAAFENSNLTGANWSYARVAGAVFNDIEYSRDQLVNRCYGAVGMSEIRGDAVFRRDFKDQAYIDSMNKYWRRRFSTLSAFGWGLVRGWVSRDFPFIRIFPAIVSLIVAAFGMELAHPNIVANDMRSLISSPAFYLMLAVVYLIVSAFQSSAGGLLANRIWSLFRHGRDWDRVVWLGFALIVVSALLFDIAMPEHVCAKIESIGLNQCGSNDVGDGNWVGVAWVAFFAAAMGFLTLGILDLMEPRTVVGGTLMVINVLSGFLTLGLLLSVLSDRFSRRE